MSESFEIHLDEMDQALMVSEGQNQPHFFLENYQTINNLPGDAKKSDRLKPLSVEQAIQVLNPTKASDLLVENQVFPKVVPPLETMRLVRIKAQELARELLGINDPKHLPLIGRLAGPVKLHELGQTDYISDTIREKLGLLALYKYLEIVGPNFEKHYKPGDAPTCVNEYKKSVLFVQEAVKSCEEFVASHDIFNQPMGEIVRSDEKWIGQDDVKPLIDDREKIRAVYQTTLLSAEALRLSNIWDKEGIITGNITKVDQESVIKLIQFNIRYVSWYTLFDDSDQDLPGAEQGEEFREVQSIINNPNHPSYLGKVLSPDQMKSLKDELDAAAAALFED